MLVIDTYNVLHAIEGLGEEAAELDVCSLGRLIASSRYRGTACMLVCDGNAGASGAVEGAEGVRVRYVGAGRDADSEIERVLSSNSSPRRILVVSSDHRLRRAAEKRRSKWLDSRSFLERILADAETVRKGGPRLSGEDKREIMRAFGVDPEEIEARRAAREGPSTGDETLDEALRHFGARLSAEDLDMDRWLGGGSTPETGT